MKHLKRFFEHGISYFDQNIKRVIPNKLEIVTDNGNYSLTRCDLMLNGDLIEIVYYHNTPSKNNGDVLVDGEPDYLDFDIHVMKKNNGMESNPDTLRLDVDITYGDAMVSEFSIEMPNKVDVIHYTGKGSKYDPDTFFGFTDESLDSLVSFFNSFGFKLSKEDFKFIDKENDEYQNPDKGTHNVVKINHKHLYSDKVGEMDLSTDNPTNKKINLNLKDNK